MKIGIPREIFEDERRVAATPPSVHKLIGLGYEVMVEAGAGEAANYTDDAYEKVGATIAADTKSLWQDADFILKVRAPMKNPSLKKHEVDLMKEGAFLVSYLWPAQNPELLEKLAAKKITSFAIDSLPRISRAQKMDALSAMANIAGYRAVIEAANNFGRFFTGQVTAAGKVPPAKIMVIGAGVAGLAAIGAANSMGAIVRAFDTRLEVKEQVESMGAEFLVPEFRFASFEEGVETLNDLKPGMVLEGSVTNVTNFGAFVDIGVHQDGLVHISALSNTFVKDPREVVKAGDIVKVKVMDVDIPRKRIALSMRMDDQPGEKSDNRAGSSSKGGKPSARNDRHKGADSGQKGAMAGALAQALASARKDGR